MNYAELREVTLQTARLPEEYVNDNFSTALIRAEQDILNNFYNNNNLTKSFIEVGQGIPLDCVKLISLRCNNYVLQRLDGNISNIYDDYENTGIGYSITDGVVQIHPYRWGRVEAYYITKERPIRQENDNNYISMNYPFIYVDKICEILFSRLGQSEDAAQYRASYDYEMQNAAKTEFNKIT